MTTAPASLPPEVRDLLQAIRDALDIDAGTPGYLEAIWKRAQWVSATAYAVLEAEQAGYDPQLAAMAAWLRDKAPRQERGPQGGDAP